MDLNDDLRTEILKAYDIEYSAMSEDGYSDQEIYDTLGRPEDAAKRARQQYCPKQSDLQKGSLFSYISSTLSDAWSHIKTSSREDKTDERFRTARLTPITIPGDYEKLVIAGGKRPVTIYIRSEEELMYELYSADNAVIPTMKVDHSGNTVTLTPRGCPAVLTLTVPSQVRNITITTGGTVTCSKLQTETLILERCKTTTYIDDCRFNILEAEMTSADTVMKQTRWDKFRLEARSGDVYIRNCSGNVNVTAKSGDIRIEDHFGDQCSTATGSGDISMKDLYTDVLQVSANSGDLSFHGGKTPSIMAMSTSCGDIACIFPDTNYTAEVYCKKDEFHNFSGLPVTKVGKRSYEVGSGTASVALTTKNGDITLK